MATGSRRGTRRRVGKHSRSARPAGRRRRVYFFGAGKARGRASMRETLGGKGANLAEMTRLGVPVPAGFTLSTEVCAAVQRRAGQLPADLKAEVLQQLGRVEKATGAVFWYRDNPMLVSLSSGSSVSMPGIMDTVLNLGLND